MHNKMFVLADEQTFYVGQWNVQGRKSAGVIYFYIAVRGKVACVNINIRNNF